MKKDSKKSKLGLEREQIKNLNARTGVQAGNVPPTYLCGGPSLGLCRSMKLACIQ